MTRKADDRRVVMPARRIRDPFLELRSQAGAAQIAAIAKTVEEWGMRTHIVRGTERSVIGLIGEESAVANRPLDLFKRSVPDSSCWRCSSWASPPSGLSV